MKSIINKIKLKKKINILKSFFNFFNKKKYYSFPEMIDIDFFGNKVLILSPHPDDEIFGMGGIISQLLKAGKEVMILESTNGNNQIRRKEIIESFKFLGGDEDLIFFIEEENFNQGKVEKEINKLLRYNYFNSIFITSIFDPHYEHQMLSYTLSKVLKNRNYENQKKVKICQYEIWNTIPTTHQVDITKSIIMKKQAMEKFKSQLQEKDRKYIERIIGLNQYRGLQNNNGYSEGLLITSIKDYISFF